MLHGEHTLCFNLVIEYLLFSSSNRTWDSHSTFHCFNLVIEYLLFSSHCSSRYIGFDRPSFNLVIEYLLFSRASLAAEHSRSIACFNLVIEYLLFSSAWLFPVSAPRVLSFQSRNRVSSLFKFRGNPGEPGISVGFNLVIEYLLFSSCHTSPRRRANNCFNLGIEYLLFSRNQNRV